jgi:hypothetical protein
VIQTKLLVAGFGRSAAPSRPSGAWFQDHHWGPQRAHLAPPRRGSLVDRPVAAFGAPMPLGPGIARPPPSHVRSHDAATACGANRIARKSPRGRKKVAQSGRIRGVFRASVHHRDQGSERGSHIRRGSSVFGHRTGLGTLHERREGRHTPILRHFRRASSASPQNCRPMSRRARDLYHFSWRNGRGSERPARRLTADRRRPGPPRPAGRESLPARRAGPAPIDASCGIPTCS